MITKQTSPENRNGTSRAVILEAAGRIFAESGLAGARTDAIAATAGLNKAMLYYYFKSKDGLYRAVMEDHFGAFNKKAIALLESPGPAGEILLQYINLHFDFISSRLRYARLYQQLMSDGGKPLEHLVRKHFVPRGKALSRLLERGMREQEFRRLDVRHTNLSIIALIVFYFSAGPVMKLAGEPNAFSPANLKRRRLEIIEFVKNALFLEKLTPNES